MKIQRYDTAYHGFCHAVHDDGEWVKASDVAKLEARNAELLATLHTLVSDQNRRADSYFEDRDNAIDDDEAWWHGRVGKRIQECADELKAVIEKVEGRG